MIKKLIYAFAIGLVSTYSTFSQNNAPHLSGTVEIVMEHGLIKADLKLSNLPSLKNYTIWLNTGMNVKYLRDSADITNYIFNGIYDDKITGDAFQYYLVEQGAIKQLPQTVRFAFSGAFPVHKDPEKLNETMDWKGYIAFDGSTLRASEQSAWCPLIYDKENDKLIDSYSYDLTIDCKDCNALYINGSKPVSASKQRFTSLTPFQPLLFTGSFQDKEIGKSIFINTNLTDEHYIVLGNETDKMIQYYEKKLKKEYGNKIVYLATTPVAKHRAWSFVTFPTVVTVGNEKTGIGSFFAKTSPATIDSTSLSYLSHEIAHYYFGTVFQPNSDLKWIFHEGITEYLALQFTRDNLGEKEYQKRIKKYQDELQNYTLPVAISEVKAETSLDEKYIYRYVPLLITGLEKQIGREKVWKWLVTVLNSNGEKTNYKFLINSLLKAGVTQKQIEAFEKTYIKDPQAFDNVKKIVAINSPK